MRAAYAHTFTSDENASFLALVEQIKVEMQLVKDNNLSSNNDLALQHAKYATRLLDANITKEILEKNKRIGTDLPAALKDLESSVAASPDAAAVNERTAGINSLLGEAVSARIEKQQLTNSTVNAIALSILVNTMLDHYYKAIPREVPEGTDGGSSAPVEGVTDGGSYKIQVSWIPPEIRAEQVNTYTVKFFDAKTGEQLDKVKYDFMFMPADNPDVMIIHRGSQSASGGEAQQSFAFKEKRVGQATLRISNINNSGEIVDFLITVLPPALDSAVSAGNKTGTMTSMFDYQTSQGLASRIPELFDQLKSQTPADKAGTVAELDSALQQLKSAVDNKGPVYDVEILVHGEVHPRLQKIFNLQLEQQPRIQESSTTAEFDGKSYSLVGKSASAKVTAAAINPGASVRVEFDNSGEVELTLPKNMVDGITAVMAGGQELDFEEVSSTDMETTIKFTVPEVDKSVEITGATVVPEFGMMATLILAVSLVAVMGFARFKGYAPSLGRRR
ncbi:PEFG-CTERM sorting domain-containing protein [Nitrososphaera sp.]|uniref:PEFG-CTERM sorting domain-containing protein n=1 Tax=Nitrososphaera sp. TaxID=1971748 RepID=UPI00307D3DE3